MSIERKILKTEREIEQDADQELLAAQYEARTAREMLEEQRETNKLLREVVSELRPTRYTIQLTQLQGDTTMALGTIAPGSTGQFGAVLLNNGAPFAGFTGTFTFTTSDPSATVAPATTDASGGTIPLANQVVVSIPTGDTLGSVSISATTTDPNGASQTGSVTVAIGGGTSTNVFSVGVTQLA
jgi:hypothetical protein